MGIKTRFLLISDTHGEDIPLPQLPTDVAIHCGDLTDESKISEFRVTLRLLENIQAPLKIVIAGNHDFTLDLPTFRSNVENSNAASDTDLVKKEYGDYGEIQKLFDEAKSKNIQLLHEGTYQFALQNGALLKVYASPFTPSTHDAWGFHYIPQQHDFFIPNDVDIAVTHGPPKGIMDLTGSNKRAGCPNLFKAIAISQPKLHCFGHMHGQWGAKLVTWRDVISDTPSHFTDIDNDKSLLIEKLSNLKRSRFDTEEEIHSKTEKRAELSRQGYIKASHSAGDKVPLQRGQTIFVNAAIQGTTDEYPIHMPWLVDIDLPEVHPEGSGA